VGFQGGNMHFESLMGNDSIWYLNDVFVDNVITPKFWNAFGVTEKLSRDSSNSITTEINIPIEGVNRNIGGLFAKRNNQIYLLHRGKIGGGQKGIGKKEFLKWYKGDKKTVSYNEKGQHRDRCLFITDLASSEFIENISKFVHNVALFKKEVQLKNICELSDESLKEKVKKEKKSPKKRMIEVSSYDRSPHVVEYAKRRANGKCQLCKKDAPFKDKNNIPYLECHHIIWISKGGKDTIENVVALCPNCHKKMHIKNWQKDIMRLKRIAQKLL